ncbi:hypothetical protein BH18ACT5_BH18ACT5_06020 [soil metagenome]
MTRSKEIAAFLASVENPERRRDSEELLELLESTTGEKPELWGSIVGFGRYRYRYASGREGEGGKIGFAARTSNLTLYLLSGLVGYGDLLSRLGPHKTGKSCLYIKHLHDLDRSVLVELIKRSVAHVDQVESELGGIPRMSEMPPPRT